MDTIDYSRLQYSIVDSPRPRPKRSEVPIRIPSIPHLLIPSTLTAKGPSWGGGGGGGPLCEPINELQGAAVKFRRLQWIWAVWEGSTKIRCLPPPSPSPLPPLPPLPPPPAPPPPSPPSPPLRVLSHYLSIYLSIYLYTHIDSYKKKFVYAQTLSLFTPQTLHPDILRKQKPQTWHHVFLPNIRPGRGGRRAAFKIIVGAKNSILWKITV